MARTPLFRQFQSMMTEVDGSTSPSLSRRHFLAGAGLSSLAAVTVPSSSASAATTSRIAIIGGGIAGLSAALALKDAGHVATVYEAADRVGGRMHSNATSWKNGQTTEWCGEFFDSDHATVLGLAKRFGLPLTDFLGAQASGSADTLYLHGRYYTQQQFASDFRPVLATLNKQLAAIGDGLTYDTLNAAGRALDATSLWHWIDTYVPGGHASQLGALLDSAYNQELGLDTREQSSLNLVSILPYQPAGSSTVSIYGQSDQRYGILGGNERLPRAIANHLGAAQVRTSQRLERIAKRSDGSYDLTFASPTSSTTVVADRVIMTIPFSVLRRLDFRNAGFDTRKQIAITELGYGTNSKLMMQFDGRPWTATGPWGHTDGTFYSDLDVQNVWDSTRGRQGETGILTAYTGGRNGAALRASTPYATSGIAHHVQSTLTTVGRVFPGIPAHFNGRATLSTPWSDPNLRGSYACWKVGQYSAFAGYEGVRQGRCHFAGEHCSTGYQGYMEGGAQEGIRAAREILHDFSKGQLL